MAKNKGDDVPEIHILDDIGPSWAGMVGAKGIAYELKALGPVDKIKVHVNSLGGGVFEGLAIYNMFKNHQAEIEMHIDGLAASIASIIAMSGDKIIMAAGSQFMIHNPWGIVAGGSSDLRKQADLLDAMTDDLANVYAARSGKSNTYFKDMMAKESWIDAETAVNLGLAHEISANKTAVVNSLSPKGYSLQNVPEAVRSCATLAAKLNARIREIEADQKDTRDRTGIVSELYDAAKGTGAEGLKVEDILAGRSGCQTDDAIRVFSKVLAVPADELRNAHVEDGCSCKPHSARESSVDHRASLAPWKLLANRIGK